ncbi:cellulase (glycosyl hydrolase family 5) protein [Actinidia rufa]|uniref:Cellulase (Glycosyl hydrolase family 5) protein n=1 Tax=Actinidia rufa TaxID=165716 RepID=A0A7J0EYF3_9ERIC|nr:cellulase (glycosyl hydrolase family 5) protein [Actinidia rufa]
MGSLSAFSLLPLLSLSILLVPTATQPAVALPLSADSRWIVDETGRRVKLACVNWASHLEAVVAEGLSKQPIGSISKRIGSMGFNCVRLTWPLYLATNESLASLTVRQSLLGLGLSESISGIQVNNPFIIDLSLINAYQAVVSSLADNNIMVILDNHISTPGWCCGNFDGNGFFGDQFFNPDVWIKGLTRMATMFRATPNVVGMSLRNELRGNKQNVNDWYRYMQKGAEAVHAANPDVLIIVSGLSYDRDFSFLLKRPIKPDVHQKAGIRDNMMRKAGFVLDQGYPLLVSEFGVDLRGTNVNDNRYLNCFLGVAAELDLDWALWTLVGSYYLREGVIGLDEVYGIFNWNWCDARNSSFLDKISAIQSPFQGPGLSEVKRHKVIFHPSTGLCVIRKSLVEPLRLGPCTESESWSYTQQRTLTIKGTYFCLVTDGLDKPVCLDVDSITNAIITSACKCLERDNMCDPGSQWFKLVDTTMSTGATTTFSRFRSVLDYLTKKCLEAY